jgi:acetyl esterase/lipase
MTRTAIIALVALLQGAGTGEVKDIAYVEGPDADPLKHRLDLFLPPQGAKFPTIVWIHGGGLEGRRPEAV